jgi:precorrin-2/cobalt-factor-2 C20-methyltransferase
MKAGQARPRILALLRQTGRWQDGHYLEYIGRDQQRLVRNLDDLEDQVGPYFSLFVIVRQERPA